MKKVYKIRRRSDGLFSTGGHRPRFTKKGKVWNGIGGLNNHLNIIYGDSLRKEFNGVSFSYPKTPNFVTIYDDCEVLVYEVVTVETTVDNDPIEAYKDRMRGLLKSYKNNMAG